MRANRSLTRSFILFFGMLLSLSVLVVQARNNYHTPSQINEQIAQMWWETHDPTLVDLIESEDQLKSVEMILLQWERENLETDSTTATTASLAYCSGYWGTHQFDGFAEYQTSGYSYLWSPNCYFDSPGNDCGDETDIYPDWFEHDNMVSFWMGPDYCSNQAPYRVYATSSAVQLDLQLHGGGSFRQYTSNAYGSWYGNAYVCLSNWLDANTLRFGRDY